MAQCIVWSSSQTRWFDWNRSLSNSWNYEQLLKEPTRWIVSIKLLDARWTPLSGTLYTVVPRVFQSLKNQCVSNYWKCGYIFRPVSGGSMNPARTLGPAIASNYYDGLWVYFIGPVMGTLLGAWSYRFIRVKDESLQAISTRSFSSSRLRQVRNHDQNVTANEVVVTY